MSEDNRYPGGQVHANDPWLFSHIPKQSFMLFCAAWAHSSISWRKWLYEFYIFESIVSSHLRTSDYHRQFGSLHDIHTWRIPKYFYRYGGTCLVSGTHRCLRTHLKHWQFASHFFWIQLIALTSTNAACHFKPFFALTSVGTVSIFAACIESADVIKRPALIQICPKTV